MAEQQPERIGNLDMNLVSATLEAAKDTGTDTNPVMPILESLGANVRRVNYRAPGLPRSETSPTDTSQSSSPRHEGEDSLEEESLSKSEELGDYDEQSSSSSDEDDGAEGEDEEDPNSAFTEVETQGVHTKSGALYTHNFRPETKITRSCTGYMKEFLEHLMSQGIIGGAEVKESGSVVYWARSSRKSTPVHTPPPIKRANYSSGRWASQHGKQSTPSDLKSSSQHAATEPRPSASGWTRNNDPQWEENQKKTLDMEWDSDWGPKEQVVRESLRYYRAHFYYSSKKGVVKVDPDSICAQHGCKSMVDPEDWLQHHKVAHNNLPYISASRFLYKRNKKEQ